MKIQFLLVILLLTPFLTHCSGRYGGHHSYDPQVIQAEIATTSYDIPIVVNEKTVAWIDYFQHRGRKHFARYLERASLYEPLMRQILREEGMPEDLFYISVIESGLNATAYSRAKAVGFWQFIGSTGRRYGLNATPYVEERQDFEKATRAAAAYYKDLYGRFGDWYLAMAGYNAGEGKIEKAIRKYKTRDFWEICEGNYLKAETKNYVPKFMAAAIIGKNPAKYGFTHIKRHEPLTYGEVRVSGATDLRVIADLAGTDHDTMVLLNPELRRWHTPPKQKYSVRVPAGSEFIFISAYAHLSEHLRMGGKEYTVGSGESIDSLAKKFHVPQSYLAMANGISEKASLSEGQTLGIPAKPPRGMKHYLNEYGNSIRHRVRSGESLWTIAHKYGVSVGQLKHWNHGQLGRYLKPGQKLFVRAPKRASQTKTVAHKARPADGGVYRVRDGDSLWTIAQANGVTISSLRKHNTLGRYLKPGQKIVIPGNGRVVQTEQASVKPSHGNVKGSSIYVVQSGDTLWTIARANDMRLADLKALNRDRLGQHLKPGQRLKLQGGSPKQAPIVVSHVKSSDKSDARQSAQASIYHVQSGDSLWSIAKKNQVRISDIRHWNEDLGPYLKPGQKIALHGTAPKTASPSAIKTVAVNASNGIKITYTIESGDTLWDIARKYKVRTSDLKKWNSVDQVRRLMPGDELTIYVDKAQAEEA
jgi:membrane-bound lytic murein transglycosylase D